MTHSIQAQFDNITNEVDPMNSELDLCIKSGLNTLTSDVTLTGNHLFCGGTSSEIPCFYGVTSNIQTQCDNGIN